MTNLFPHHLTFSGSVFLLHPQFGPTLNYCHGTCHSFSLVSSFFFLFSSFLLFRSRLVSRGFHPTSGSVCRSLRPLQSDLDSHSLRRNTFARLATSCVLVYLRGPPHPSTLLSSRSPSRNPPLDGKLHSLFLCLVFRLFINPSIPL